MRFFTNLLLGLGLATAIDVIEIKGRHFVPEGSDDAFFMRGIAYQPGGASGVESGADPLSDKETCLRDVYVWQQLNINTIRVYSVDPHISHDECMSILAAAGIYVILDVNSGLEGQHLNRYEPWTTYTETYLTHVFEVIEAFAGYDNTLAFFAGNEIINDEESAEYSPAYIKAVVRDMKAYMRNHIHRPIPVGYSAADVLEYRMPVSEYLECGDEWVDFYGVNTYQWCGDQTFESSDYDVLTEDYEDYSLPIIFSEFGCNRVTPRTFGEVEAMFSDQMTHVFSGGLVYEYNMEQQADGMYGVVEIDGNTVEYLEDEFSNLQSAYWNAATPTYDASGDTPTRPTACQSSYSGLGTISVPSTQAQDLIDNGIDTSNVHLGEFVTIDNWETEYTILDEDGSEVTDKAVQQVSAVDSAPRPTGGYNPLPSGTASDPATDTGSAGTTPTAAAIQNSQLSLGLAFSCLIGALFFV